MALVYSRDTVVFGDFLTFKAKDQGSVYGIDQLNNQILLTDRISGGPGNDGVLTFMTELVRLSTGTEKYKYFRISNGNIEGIK